MKFAKTLVLQALMLTALAAFASSASATSLTSPAGATYTGTIKAESTNVTFQSPFGSFGTWTCWKSTLEFKPEAHGSTTTTVGKLTSLTFECAGGNVTNPVAQPGTFELHTEGTSSNGNATVTWSGAKIVFDNTALGTCTFETGYTDFGVLTGSNNTGKTATLDLKATVKDQAFCGVAWMSGSYVVTTPDYLAAD